jgi:Sap, sulfolipid-1-addressing protein
MLTQAAGLSVLAAISPTALLVAAALLGSASPRRTAVAYLAGAIIVTALMAAIAFVVLRAGHFNLPSRQQARYGLRLGLGLLLLLGAAFLWNRARRRHAGVAGGEGGNERQGQQKEGLISRLIARPAARTAFLAGLLVYLPSITFIAAVQVVATSGSNLAHSLVALILVVVISISFVWLPLMLYLLAPDRTGRQLARFNAWLRRYGQALLVDAVAAAGVILTVGGLLGLTGAR